MCRDCDTNAAQKRELSLSEIVESNREELAVLHRRLNDVVEDLYAIANRVGMELPSSSTVAVMEPRRG